MPSFRDPTIIMTSPRLTTKAKQIKNIGLVNMIQGLKVTKFGGPH